MVMWVTTFYNFGMAFKEGWELTIKLDNDIIQYHISQYTQEMTNTRIMIFYNLLAHK